MTDVKETQKEMEFEKPESGPTNLCLASIHSTEYQTGKGL